MPNASKPSKPQSIALVADDPWLAPYEEDILERRQRFRDRLKEIESQAGSLLSFANAYQWFGINRDRGKKGWWYREMGLLLHINFRLLEILISGTELLIRFSQNEQGIWEIFISEDDLKHGDLVKVHIVADNGAHDRIPAYIKRAVQDPESYDFSGQIWEPDTPFVWTDQGFSVNPDEAPIIYECHTGMALEKEGVGKLGRIC